jgi:hypothetical protein
MSALNDDGGVREKAEMTGKRQAPKASSMVREDENGQAPFPNTGP